jgi:hypothetical protein
MYAGSTMAITVGQDVDPFASIDPDTPMSEIDRFHWETKDGAVFSNAAGEGFGPRIIQGQDLILEIRTLSNINGFPNDIELVTFQAQFRKHKNDPVVQATAAPFVGVPNPQSDTIRLQVLAADTALIVAHRGVWDLEATWTDTEGTPLLGVRTRRILEGRFALDREVTKI